MQGRGEFFFRGAPFVVIALLIGPVIAGLAFIIGPAFGYAPLLGATRIGLRPLTEALLMPGLADSVWLSLWIGPATALLSLAVVAGFVASFQGTRFFQAVVELMRPALAVPHAAAALGLAFLIAPSGFLLRLVSPELTGFERPPDWLIVNDPNGWAMFFGLVVKEIPFLFLVTLAALSQAEGGRVRVARALGHGRLWGWIATVFPSVYAQIRLPVFAVIAFASSVVDVAIILGPVAPPPLAVRVLRLMNDPDLSMRLVAGATALIQVGVTGAAILCWWGFERIAGWGGKQIACSGTRFCRDGILRGTAGAAAVAGLVSVLGGIFVLGLWSVGDYWRFPLAFPPGLSFSVWMDEAKQLGPLVWRTAFIGLASSLMSLLLVILCLENEYRRGISLTHRATLILYAPLLVPQIAFIAGFSAFLLRFGLDGTLAAVVFAHMFFVLPYIYLSLSDAWGAFDKRYLDIARGLGHSANGAFIRVRLPVLLGPILSALALGFAVSVAQYLPTLLIGAGRMPTVTTEAVALSSGGDRRLIGVYALMQTLLPFGIFLLAGLVPAYMWRHRRALQPWRHS